MDAGVVLVEVDGRGVRGCVLALESNDVVVVVHIEGDFLNVDAVQYLVCLCAAPRKEDVPDDSCDDQAEDNKSPDEAVAPLVRVFHFRGAHDRLLLW